VAATAATHGDDALQTAVQLVHALQHLLEAVADLEHERGALGLEEGVWCVGVRCVGEAAHDAVCFSDLLL
jgi:hypothetical protein